MTIKERPIPFSAPMVRAILGGKKTQTRRLVKMRSGRLMEEGELALHLDDTFDCVMDFSQDFPYWRKLDCPYGVPGDRLWVREAWAVPTTVLGAVNHLVMSLDNKKPIYKADGTELPLEYQRWRHARFMFRNFSRIDLEITSIRVERLQAISEADAEAEGTELPPCTYIGRCKSNSCPRHGRLDRYRLAYAKLWDSINGKTAPWESDPFVWVIGFTPRREGSEANQGEQS